MADPHAHCWERIQFLKKEFLAGTGGGDIFECLVLTYLEVAEVAAGRDPNLVWDGWMEVLSEAGTEEPLNRKLGDTKEGREKLVEALEKYTSRFSLPRRRAFTVPPSPVEEVEEPTLIESLFGAPE